jgi:hypothetical protein
VTIKVIGAGLGRTGTLSLKYALEYMGFEKCYHMSEILKNHPEHIKIWTAAMEGNDVNWSEFLRGYQAIVDYPGCLFYKELLQKYPKAKVILTHRDPDRWYDSTLATLFSRKKGVRFFRNPLRVLKAGLWRKSDFGQHFIEFQDQLLWSGLFNGQFIDKEYAINIYQQHLNAVKQVVPTEQLLVFHVKEGWEPICQFLDVPIPTGEPFPHLNSRTRPSKKRTANPIPRKLTTKNK